MCVCLSLCVCVSLSVCVFVSVYVCQSVCTSACVCVCVFVCFIFSCLCLGLCCVLASIALSTPAYGRPPLPPLTSHSPPAPFHTALLSRCYPLDRNMLNLCCALLLLFIILTHFPYLLHPPSPLTPFNGLQHCTPFSSCCCCCNVSCSVRLHLSFALGICLC